MTESTRSSVGKRVPHGLDLGSARSTSGTPHTTRRAERLFFQPRSAAAPCGMRSRVHGVEQAWQRPDEPWPRSRTSTGRDSR